MAVQQNAKGLERNGLTNEAHYIQELYYGHSVSKGSDMLPNRLTVSEEG